MPRTGPRRGAMAFRVSDEQRKLLEAQAARDGVKLSEVVRRAVDEYLRRT